MAKSKDKPKADNPADKGETTPEPKAEVPPPEKQPAPKKEAAPPAMAWCPHIGDTMEKFVDRIRLNHDRNFNFDAWWEQHGERLMEEHPENFLHF